MELVSFAVFIIMLLVNIISNKLIVTNKVRTTASNV
jgi:hypothetical protein